MACVKPVRLSVQAIRISSTPRALRSVRTVSQKAADSFSAIHMPRTSFNPLFLSPITMNIHLLMDISVILTPVSVILTP
jgi:hypothetical protein